jgi:cytochrome c553
MAKPPPKSSRESPAGSPPEQSAIDRPWRVRAAGVVAAALITGSLLGFVIIPAGQKSGGHLTMGHAMERAAGLAPGSPAVPQPLSSATSIPVSTVSWSPEIMAILAAGNSRRGAELAANTCAACHGEKGLSQSTGVGAGGVAYPSLAGQSPYAIYKQLHDYRSGARANPLMSPVAAKLSEADLAAVAAYYSDASKEYAAVGSRELLGDLSIERLAREGDSHRALPACLACHINGSGGPIETPVITGQIQDYLLVQLNAFAAGQRKNDVYGRMRDVSRKLTPAERAALARYFQGTL